MVDGREGVSVAAGFLVVRTVGGVGSGVEALGKGGPTGWGDGYGVEVTGGFNGGVPARGK